MALVAVSATIWAVLPAAAAGGFLIVLEIASRRGSNQPHHMTRRLVEQLADADESTLRKVIITAIAFGAVAVGGLAYWTFSLIRHGMTPGWALWAVVGATWALRVLTLLVRRHFKKKYPEAKL